ncbi:hypothetical protein TNCV_3722011 [Trichonephila clavipes]|nr:hypothetical protein TNCV_3722011 [Trichonephila clavipes]
MRGHGSLEVKVSDRDWRVMSSSRKPFNTHSVGERCTLNLLRAKASTRWCDVVVQNVCGHKDKKERDEKKDKTLIESYVDKCNVYKNCSEYELLSPHATRMYNPQPVGEDSLPYSKFLLAKNR